ncbi:MAG: gliding motility-associated C-terminal domain-containing protein [Chitinophagales bacterium]
MKKVLQIFLLIGVFTGVFTKNASALTLSETHTNVTCYAGSTGSINITPNLGTAPISYVWNDGNTNEDRVNLAAGTYSVTATDFSGATASISVTLTQGPKINMSFAVTSVSCGGGNTGAVNMTVSGGYGSPYTYYWNDGTATEDRTGLTAQVYYVTVTDNNGCQNNDSANVTQPPGMVLTKTTTNVTCGSGANGAINLTVQFGIPGYTYHWNDNIATEDRSGIAAGTYTVTVTDASGCTASTSATVNQSGGGMSINKTTTNPTCNGASNGGITVTSVVGSVGPYTFNWSTGATTQNVTGLGAGSYVVTATSTTGCTASASATLTQPAAINITLNVISVTCYNGNNGAINTSVTGGTTPYSYSWGSGVFTQNRTGLAAGNYTVTVTDFKGCTATATANVPQPLDLVASSVPSQLACTGGPSGSVFTNIAGGTSPYTYYWGPGQFSSSLTNVAAGNYTVTVTDANGCTATASSTIVGYTPMTTSTTQVNNACFGGTTGSIDLSVSNGWTPYSYSWTNSQTSQDITGLAAGSYTVTVTDNHNCTVTKTATITQPAFGMTINSTVSNVNCFGGNDGSISINVTNGTSPYAYNWGGGIVTQNRTALTTGTYVLTCTDNSGCSASSSISVTQPTQLSVSSTVTNIACNGATTGGINLTVNGGIAPYTYAWNDGGNTQNRTNLAAGTYTVTVNDNHSCSITATATILQAPAISVSVTPTAANCNGAATGSLTVAVSGGNSPYSFNWGGGVVTQNRTNLTAGTYTVTVSDNLSCSTTASGTITEPTAISISSTITNVACAGGNTGAINLSVSGGTSPYTFDWGGGISSQNRTNLAVGSYTVTVSDNNSCTSTHTASITQATTLSASATITNVSCFGGMNGAITLNISGGTSPYTYSWAGGGSGPSKTSIGAGNYVTTITDNAGCGITYTSTVTEPAAIAITPTVTNVACAGGNTGAISIAVTGGNGGYTFNWGGGVTTQNRSSLAAGSYSVTVTDALGCNGVNTSSVTQNSSLTINAVAGNVSCNGGSNGTITVTPSGGTSPYTYNWGGGIITQNRSGLAAGSYTVTVNDNAGCSGTANAAVTQPAVISTSTTITDVSCNGGNNGAINLTVSGGTSPYTFNWGGGVVTQNRTNVTAATYNVTVTDNNLCTASATAVVAQPAALALSTSTTNVSCNGGNNGAVNLTVTGGTAPYAYIWSNFFNTQNISNLTAATYSVTVTDNKSCTASASATITQPAGMSLSTSVTNATCFGGTNGAIDLTVSGGATPYTYSWSNAATAQDITAIAAGNFVVNVTDANNCVATTSATVTEPSQINVVANQTNINCFGANSGLINLNVSGGTGAYTYTWNNSSTASSLSNLAAGTYTVTVKDAANCSATKSATITEPAALVASQTHTNVLCNGANTGAITITVNGGTTPYQFTWNDAAVSQNRTNLAAGTYNVTVMDANNCAANTGATLTQPTAITLSTTKTDVVCNAATTGAIDLTVSGGTGSYTYQWSNFYFTQDLSGVAAGTYTVTVSDGNGCQKTNTTTISQPSPISINVNVTNVSCYGASNGAINAAATGGNGSFVYNWSNGGSTWNLTGLSAGSYVLTVTDAMNCTANLSLSVSQPSQILLSQTHTNVTCNGANTGAIDLSAAGGAGVYTYLWSNGAITQDINGLAAGNYVVTATDGSGCTASLNASLTQPTAINLSSSVTDVLCNGASTGAINLTVSGGQTPYQFAWSNSATTQNLSNIAAGNYSVQLTDANSCTASAAAVVNQSAAIQLSLSKSDASCFGGNNGSVTTTVNGGTGSYTYNWSNAATTANVSGLTAATYTVTVRDGNNCSVSSSATVAQPTQIQINETHANVSCNGGNNASITTSVSGGVSPYAYAWNTGSNNAAINGLNANTYTVLITDNNSCTAMSSVTITEPAVLSLSETHTPYACTSSAGTIDLTVAGGTGPYAYNWNTGATTQDLANLNAGNYDVLVTDANSCTAMNSVTIVSIPALNTSYTKVDVTCFGAASGSIDVTVSGGQSPYSYSWTGGGSTEDISGLTAGTYNVQISDASNCSSNLSINIAQPSQIQITHTATDVLCFGGNTGTISANANGGVSPYTYTWTTAANTPAIANLIAGNYAVTVTDANNCSMVQSGIAVAQPAALSATSVITDVACVGHTDGEVLVTPAGGVPPYTFNWSNSQNGPRIINLNTGNYDVTVTDNNGCTTTKSNTVNMTTPLNLSSVVANTSCPQVQNGAIDLSVSGGTAGYTFNWTNGDNTEDLSGLDQGTYTVTVTDSRNCSSQANFTLTYDYILTVDATPSTTINLGEEVALNATTNVDHGNTYSWTPSLSVSCSNCANTKAVPTHNTFYTVNVVDANGCSAMDTLSVTVNSITDLFIPNVFTPNNDGNNDIYQLYGDISAIEFLEFKVFNRWGEMVYSTNDHQFTWDGVYKGQPVEPGAYIYTMKVVFINGYTRNDYKGSITILR